MSRGFVCAGMAASLSFLLVVSVGSPASAAGEELAAGCGPGALVATDEAAALALAAECNAAVEIESARGFAQRQLAKPDGTVTLESYLRPKWAYDRVGRWVEVDPTLVADPVHGISTVATVVDVEVSPGGSGPLVTTAAPAGESLRLTWPAELPAPVLEGATATYPEVFDGVDLRVTAGADYFSYALVVRSAVAAGNPQLASVEVGIEGDGLAVAQRADGAVVARDRAGEVVFSAGGAYMWDASSPVRSTEPEVQGLPGGDLPGADPGRVAEAEVELTGGKLRVVPDRSMLTHPGTEFPVTIDPTFSVGSSVWTVVGDGQYADDTWWNDGAWPRNEGLRMGFQGWTEPGTEGYGVWRSIARFDTAVLRGSVINSASVGLRVFHTGGCDSYPLELWHTGVLVEDAVPTSWNSTSGTWRHGGPLDTQVVPSANGTGEWCAVMPERQVTFDGEPIRRWVQRWADIPFSSITLGLRSGDESDIQQWMRAYPESFVLTVNYNPVTAVPSGLTIDGVGCLAPAGSRVTGSAPVLAAVPRHSEGTVQADVHVRTADGAENLRTWRSGAGPTGQRVSWQVDAPLPDGEYRWRMRSVNPDTEAVSAWSGWCGFTVDGSRDAGPGLEDPRVVECPVPAGEPVEAADESVALLLARACDARAEVTSQRDFDRRVWAQPDGRLLAEQYTRPQWARDADDEWVDTDPSFQVGGDGSITTAAAVSEIKVSSGGAGPLLTATDPDGGTVSLSWPEPLPAPVVDGATVTYPEVFSDVDLQVAAGVDGFSYVLVVKSAAAAASPELASVSVGIDAAGGLELVQEAGGGVAAQDATGEAVFSSPAAYMWDSSQPAEPAGLGVTEEGSGDPEDVPPGQFTQMPLELAGDTLTVEPDQALLTDPDVEFPVLIDPPFSGRRMHWASVHRGQPSRGWTDDSSWPRVGAGGRPEMRVGNLQWWPGFPCGAACGLWRSAIRFNIRKLGGKQIVSAAVKATQTHTSGCGSYGLQLWYVTAFRSGTSWNGLSDNWQNRLQTRTVASSNRTGGCGGSTPARGVTFNNASVRNRVQAHADAGHNSLSFGFRSSDESSKQAYRRIAVGSVKLEVVYNRPAKRPVGLSTDGRGCETSSPGPWLTTRRPVLSGKPRDPDGRVGAHLQVRRSGSVGTYYAWKSGTNRKHRTVVNHRIRHRDRLPSGSYRWRMRSLDSHPQGTDSPWRQWCYFRVDVTSPTTPTVELLGDPPAAGEQVTLRLRSSDAHSGLAGFSYGVDEEVKRHSVSSSGTATVTVTAPASGGRTWIYVWSRDSAGNVSNRAVFDFFAARFVEATPAAAWRLDGDGLDDSGHGHELMLGRGVSWENDAAPPADGSLRFDGTGCVATEGPVVRTDAEYTIAAWVRLDDDSASGVILGQVGAVRPAFDIRYQQSTNKWLFALPDADDRGVSWASVRSAQDAVVGRWTHLAVRVDPAARHMQMYVDGGLSAEASIPFIPWNADGPLHLGCATSLRGSTWGRYQGAVHHAGVWQGLLTPAQLQEAYEGALPAGLTGDWRLRSDGADASAHARDVTAPTTGVSWVDDQYGRRRSSMRLDGTSWAESAGPIVRTDRSFSVSAWVKLDDKNGTRQVAAQAGGQVANFNLYYHHPSDRWQLSMASQDDESAVAWHRARSTGPPVVGEWYHLAGVYDHQSGRVRLYVNGELQGDVLGPSQPWRAEGVLLVGAAGNRSGERYNPMVGTISDVKTWRGALTDARVAEVFGGNPAVEWLARWNLNGDGGDTVGGNDLSLAGVEGVDYEWVEDRACLPFRALGLRLSGSGYAETAGPVVVTDESFTVTAWVKLDSVTGDYQTVLAQRGAGRAAMYLQATPEDSWRLSMPQQESGETGWAAAESAAGSVTVGAWTHLAGVFDLAAGEVRLFVNGELADVGAAVESPWHADGPFYIGSAGLVDGAVDQPVHGAIDTVTAWSSTLDPDRVADMARPSPFGGGPCP